MWDAIFQGKYKYIIKYKNTIISRDPIACKVGTVIGMAEEKYCF